MSILLPENSTVAGNGAVFTCTAVSASLTDDRSFSWENSQGEIVSGERIIISDYSFNNFSFESVLNITELMVSDGDSYTCNITISLPEVGTNISNMTSADIRVEGMYILCMYRQVPSECLLLPPPSSVLE